MSKLKKMEQRDAVEATRKETAALDVGRYGTICDAIPALLHSA